MCDKAIVSNRPNLPSPVPHRLKQKEKKLPQFQMIAFSEESGQHTKVPLHCLLLLENNLKAYVKI